MVLGMGFSGWMSALVAVVFSLVSFTSSNVQAGDGARDAYRKRMRAQIQAWSSDDRSAPAANDQAVKLVDRLELTRLADMDAQKLTQVTLPQSPWSDSYWPTYRGLTAMRYADPAFPNSMDWRANADYLLARIGASADVDQLSPAEKYDRLIGDADYTLTRNQIDQGRPYYEQSGEVADWMGLCHGWAPAAYSTARPVRTVQALAADGVTQIRFYPADIKALTTLLWSNGRFRTRFIGGRCNDQKPKLDAAGRPIKPDCLDTNPGTWHLSVVNQLGVSKRSLIIDSNFDHEVWNFPVLSYEYTYFDPRTGKSTPSLAEAKIPLASYAADPYAGFRAPTAREVVGIRMRLRYVSETEPTAALEDSEANDYLESTTYQYDLELDENGQIVGGEWHTLRHPDFLWTSVPNVQPTAIGDYLLDKQGDKRVWLAGQPVPPSWRESAVKSSRSAQPLTRIVRELIRRAQ